MIHRLMVFGLSLMLAACATAPNATAQTAAASESPAVDIGTIFDTRTAEFFGDATVALRGYLAAREPAPVGQQHFCIVGYDYPTGGRSALVHWREGQMLLYWNGFTDPAYAADSIRFTPRDLDLTKDVVATEADINSSTYLVTRAWVDKVFDDCAAKGARYTVSL
jgi:starvation-inducible outer membrane lipoprotein